MTIFDDNFWWQFLMTIFDDNFWWQFLMIILMPIFDANFWCQFLMPIFDDHFWRQFLMTIFESKGSSLSLLPRKVVPFLWPAQLQPFGNKKNIFPSPPLKRFWNGKDFHDVPLVCKYDRTKQTHKMILAASKTKHSLQLHKTTNMDGCIVKGEIFSSNFLFNIFSCHLTAQ